jgi:SAM-dependent methyltransferase
MALKVRAMADLSFEICPASEGDGTPRFPEAPLSRTVEGAEEQWIQRCLLLAVTMRVLAVTRNLKRERHPDHGSGRRTDAPVRDALDVKRERHREWTRTVALPVTDWLIRALAVQPGETMLELAAGAGDVGLAIVEQLGDRVRLISSDLSPSVVEVAQRAATERGLRGITFQVLDAQDLDMPSSNVDAVVCRWGYMLMEDPAAALRQTARVLRLGGRLALSVWGDPTQNPSTTIGAEVLAHIGYEPIAGPTAPGGMYSLANPDRLVAMVRASGLAVQRTEKVSVALPYSGVEDYFVQGIDQPGHRGDFFRGLSSEKRDQAAQLATTLLEPYRANAGYLVPGETLNMLASKGHSSNAGSPRR